MGSSVKILGQTCDIWMMCWDNVQTLDESFAYLMKYYIREKHDMKDLHIGSIFKDLHVWWIIKINFGY